MSLDDLVAIDMHTHARPRPALSLHGEEAMRDQGLGSWMARRARMAPDCAVSGMGRVAAPRRLGQGAEAAAAPALRGGLRVTALRASRGV